MRRNFVLLGLFLRRVVTANTQHSTTNPDIKGQMPLNAHKEHEKQHSKMPYTGETAVFGNENEIDQKAKTVIENYEDISINGKFHLFAQVLVLSFLSGSRSISHKFENDYFFRDKSHERALALKSLYDGFMNKENQVTISHNNIEEDYESLAKLQSAECPVYRVLFQMNKECSGLHFMARVGIITNHCYKYTDEAEKIHSTYSLQITPVLDVRKTMRDLSGEVSLCRYINSIKYPEPILKSGRKLLSVEYANIDYYNGTMIFYSDPTIRPSIYMPDRLDLQRREFNDEIVWNSYVLKAVIIKEGERNDVFNMKVLHRPEENSIEFVKVANKKGYYFLYA
ncbi:hypothetical protein ENBRE01_2811 [Enteropsectra breve]|nr:hypothetical protein ENBRE01_2811 [Enteropsectra breve]